ncbi:MAG: nucleotide exchange factor GrpE [Amphiplicatus sp.]
MSDFDYPPNNGQPEDEGENGAAVGADEAQALREELSALNDKVLRLAAELENTRRRADREKQEAGRYAIASFARDLLSVADTFERALGTAPAEGETVSPETLSALVSGIRMTDAALLTVLERHGVKRIDPKGEKFDPNLHMAVAQAPGDAPAGHVLDVAQPGFVIGDRVLRAAMVVVSTGAPSGNGQSTEEKSTPGGQIDTSA